MTGPRPRFRRLPAALGVAALAVAAACGAGPEAPEARAPSRPNVLVYLVDTLRADHLGVYGYGRDTSPHLDAFAADAVRYARAYSTTSWTRPAVASLLTGLDPVRHGVTARSSRLGAESRLLGEYLQAEGYHTAAFVTNPHVLPVWGFGRGFDVFVDVEATRGPRAHDVNEAFFAQLEEGLPQPFFAYLHTRDPHDPYEPPAPFAGRFAARTGQALRPPQVPDADTERLAATVAAYDEEILANDHAFGALVDRLRAEGLYRDTVIVFVSDHGEEFGDHGAGGHGLSLFEEVVRVPLLLKLPEERFAGTVVEAPVQLTDMVPTLLGAVGVAPPPELDGRDVGPDAGPPEPDRPLPFQLYLSPVQRVGQTALADAVRVGPHKLIHALEPEAGWMLFDLEADPQERRDLSAEAADRMRALRPLLEAVRQRGGSAVRLWLVGGGVPGTVRAEGTLETDGHFRRLVTQELEEGDEARLAEDGRSLHFGVDLETIPNPAGELPRHLVDRDRLMFAVDPPEAEVRVVRFTMDGEAGAFYLGPGRTRAEGRPPRFVVADEGLRVAQMAALFRGSRFRSITAGAGAYLGVVGGDATATQELDPELRARLRALGYAP